MRIAVWHNLPSGGGRRAMVDHVENLVARGHDVEVYCPDEALDEGPTFPTDVAVHTFPMALHARGRQWSATPPAPVVLDRLRAVRRHATQVAHRIRQGRFDVLYAGACRYTRAPSVARSVDIPSVLYLGEPYRWLYEALPELPLAAPVPRAFSRRRLTRLGWHAALRSQARFELRSASSFDRILVNSWFSRENVLRAYGLEAQVCRLGIDMARFKAPHGGISKKHQVVGLGAIVPEKRVLTAVRAIAGVASPRPRLRWIGNVSDPQYAAECRHAAEAQDVDLEINVGISDEELSVALHESELMLYAPRLEPFGYAPLEAAAAGLPVVGVAEGGIRETVVDGVTGLLVDGEISSLSNALETLLTDVHLRHRLGSQARERVERDWAMPPSIDRLERHLNEVVGRRRATCRS